MTTTKAADPLTYRSGFCGPSNPPDSHSRCRGAAVTHRGTLTCICPCHQPPQDEETSIPLAPPATPPPRPAGPDHEDIDDAVTHLEAGARALNVAALALPDLTFDEVVTYLERIEVLRQAVQASEDTFTQAAWKAKGDRYGDTDVPGVGAVTLRRGGNRKSWDHEALAGEVIDRHMIEREGELPDPDTVKRWLLDAAGIGYWRVGALADLGVDVDDYCATSPGKVSVQFHRPGVGNRLLSSPPSDAL